MIIEIVHLVSPYVNSTFSVPTGRSISGSPGSGSSGGSGGIGIGSGSGSPGVGGSGRKIGPPSGSSIGGSHLYCFLLLDIKNLVFDH